VPTLAGNPGLPEDVGWAVVVVVVVGRVVVVLVVVDVVELAPPVAPPVMMEPLVESYKLSLLAPPQYSVVLPLQVMSQPLVAITPPLEIAFPQ
jgi:hypothetical protein